jgi:hypothetical protein
MEKVSRSIFDGWSPPGELLTSDLGRFVVACVGGRISTVLELRRGADRTAVRFWIAAWLEAWLAARPALGRRQRMTFLYLTLRDIDLGSPDGQASIDGPIREAGIHRDVHSPEAWDHIPMSTIVRFAIDDLRGTGGLPARARDVDQE